MANCPHCGRKLHLYDWKPECPGCGTNLNYYDANQRLLDESEKAEIEHTLFQPKIDRAKAAYAGSPFAVIRIILTLLPAGALFLPLLEAPGHQLNAIGAFNKLRELGFDAVLGNMLHNPVCLAAGLLLVSAAMIIVSLVLILMSLGKHGKIRVPITYGVLFLCAVGAAAAAYVWTKQPVGVFEGDPAPARLGPGAYLFVALLFVLLAYNIFLLKKGIPVKYTQCLIGGLPSEEYFRYVDEGMPKSQIQRKMLLALARMEDEQERELEKEGAETHA
ncbi:MAG: hypothetical protein IJT27_06130 [Clostridia bacterium]|nr:hypothetical protein [Clostridia bacterium]